MRSDLLSKRLFLVGCLGLPWLWAVHAMYHMKGNDEENDEGILNPDDHFQDDDDADPEQIKLETQKWVGRCRVGAVIGAACFIGWIVTAQVLRGSVFPASLYILNSEDEELTGW